MTRSLIVVAFLLLAVTVAVAVSVAIRVAMAVIVIEETSSVLAGRCAVVDELSDQLVKGRELVVLANSCLVEVGKVCETSLLYEVDEQGNPCLSIELVTYIYCILQQTFKLLTLCGSVSLVL
jgi:hypothetical protein